MTPDIEIKFDLHFLTPDRVPAGDLADLLRDLEQAIEIEAALEDESPRDDALPALALVDIRTGSSSYAFTVDESLKPSVSRILRGLASGGTEWASVAPEAQECAHRLVSRLTKKNIPVTIKSGIAGAPEVRFSESRFPPEVNKALFIEGVTARSVEVIRAGGVKPTGLVHLVGSGQRIAVRGNKKLIQQLGSHLYKRSVVKGVAQWRIKDWKLVSIYIKEVEPYPGQSVEDVFAESRRLLDAGSVPHSIPDFIEEFRGEDDE